MVPFCRLLGALSEFLDPRRAEGQLYPLAPLLLFTVLALLSSATSYRRNICFLEQRREVLNELFGITLKRAPSVNTLRTVLHDLDGKTLKGSFDYLNNRKAAQALSAFVSEAAILLTRSEIDNKSHKIPLPSG